LSSQVESLNKPLCSLVGTVGVKVVASENGHLSISNDAGCFILLDRIRLTDLFTREVEKEESDSKFFHDVAQLGDLFLMVLSEHSPRQEVDLRRLELLMESNRGTPRLIRAQEHLVVLLTKVLKK
jgi:hypothetical protein